MKASFVVLLSAACAWPVVSLAADPVATSSSSSVNLGSREHPFGAFVAPAAMPPGSTAAFAYMGVPEVGAGYRQGVGPLELDANFKFDYFALSFALEGGLRVPVYREGPWRVAPSLAVGAVFDTGSRYIDDKNFGFVGLRVLPGATMSYRLAETASLVGEVQVPIDFALSRNGGWHYAPVAGGGGEIYLGDNISAGVVMDLGADVIKEPLGVPQTRFKFALRAGLGFRFF